MTVSIMTATTIFIKMRLKVWDSISFMLLQRNVLLIDISGYGRNSVKKMKKTHERECLKQSRSGGLRMVGAIFKNCFNQESSQTSFPTQNHYLVIPYIKKKSVLFWM